MADSGLVIGMQTPGSGSYPCDGSAQARGGLECSAHMPCVPASSRGSPSEQAQPGCASCGSSSPQGPSFPSMFATYTLIQLEPSRKDVLSTYEPSIRPSMETQQPTCSWCERAKIGCGGNCCSFSTVDRNAIVVGRCTNVSHSRLCTRVKSASWQSLLQ